MSPSQIRILLADDHTLVRRGIAQLLSMEEDMEVVGEAEDGLQACELALKARPDLILLDLQMPRMSGLEALVRLRRELPETIVVVLTYSAESEDALAALRMGAQGYLLKNLEPEALCAHIRAAVHGDSPISGQVARNLLLSQSRPEEAVQPAQPTVSLSQREEEIVRLIVKGLTNRKIASTIYLSEYTVKNHVKRILEKLELQNRAQVVAWATRSGLADDGQ